MQRSARTNNLTGILSALFAIVMCIANIASAVESKLVFDGKDGRLQYAPAANGDRIPDFSNAGYMGGGVKLPDVPVKLVLEPAPKASDDTERIQRAIDEVSKLSLDKSGFRGAVLLKRGTYRIEGQLNIHASGVVLRGEGEDENGTVLVAAGKKQRDLIVIDGQKRQEIEKSRQKITDDYVPVGAASFNVADASGFHVGDTVLVHRIGNADWIHFIAMDRITPRPGNPESTKQWQPFELHFDRVITNINGKRITIDAPITCSMDSKWGGGAISRYDDRRIENAGVLTASGLIAGEALCGLLVAGFRAAEKSRGPNAHILPVWTWAGTDWMAIVVMVLLAVLMIRLPLKMAGRPDEPAPPTAIM